MLGRSEKYVGSRQTQSRVRLTKTVQFDLMAHRLTKADVCDEIIAWIDRGEPVKEVVLHSFPNLVGQIGIRDQASS